MRGALYQRCLVHSVALVIAAALPDAGHALAAPVVEWRASGPGCPDPEQLSGLVSESTTPESVAVATVTVTASGGEWTAVVDVIEPAAQARRFRGASCGEVAAAAALYIGLVGDRPPPPAPRPRPWPIFADGGARLDVGALPRTTLGVAARVGGRIGRLGIEAGASWFDSRRARLAVDRRFGGDFGLWTGTLRGCVQLLGPGWACAAGEVGALSSTGLGGPEPLTDSSLWLAGGAGARFRQRLVGPAVIVIDLELLAPVRRIRYEVAGLGEVHRARAAVGRVGLFLRFERNLTDSGPPLHY